MIDGLGSDKGIQSGRVRSHQVEASPRFDYLEMCMIDQVHRYSWRYREILFYTPYLVKCNAFS
jgi:hypothetical protein